MDTPSKPGTGVGTGRNTMPPARMNSPTKQPIRQQIPRHNPAPPPPPPPQAPVPIKAQALAPRQKVQRNIPTPPPPAPESHPQTTGSHRHTSIGPNPTTTVNQQQRHNMGNRLGQQPGHSRPGNNSNGPTIQSGTRTSTDNRNLDISNIKSALIPTMKAPQIQHRQPETPVPIPHNPPVGFYTGRAALNLEGSNGIIPEQAPAFNPHKPTTIPRSAGIDHTKSSPVPRKQIQGNPLGPSSPSAGFSPPNIQNPSLTPGRQIGVPPPGRTTAFRAPGLAGTKRTADSHNSM
jgi:DNA repair and recombination protein RAD52